MISLHWPQSAVPVLVAAWRLLGAELPVHLPGAVGEGAAAADPGAGPQQLTSEAGQLGREQEQPRDPHALKMLELWITRRISTLSLWHLTDVITATGMDVECDLNSLVNFSEIFTPGSLRWRLRCDEARCRRVIAIIICMCTILCKYQALSLCLLCYRKPDLDEASPRILDKDEKEREPWKICVWLCLTLKIFSIDFCLILHSNREWVKSLSSWYSSSLSTNTLLRCWDEENVNPCTINWCIFRIISKMSDIFWWNADFYMVWLVFHVHPFLAGYRYRHLALTQSQEFLDLSEKFFTKTLIS